MKKYLYCEVIGNLGNDSFGHNIRFNFGGADDCIENQRMNEITITSMVDAANYLSTYNWELVQAYGAVKYHPGAELHWVFKKEVSDEEFKQATFYL